MGQVSERKGKVLFESKDGYSTVLSDRDLPPWVQEPKPKLGSAPCPVCGKFAKVVSAGWIDTPDIHEWKVVTWCKKDGTQSTW